MKKYILLLLLSGVAGAQSRSGPFSITSGTSPCASIGTIGQSTVGINVTGTFVATLQPEVSLQGQAATNIQVVPSGSSTPQATITAAGNYTAQVAGYDTFYVCVTSYTSGSVLIYLNSTKAAALGPLGGGGGAGAAFQVNGTPTSSQTTINFVSGTNITASNPSAGNVNESLNSTVNIGTAINLPNGSSIAGSLTWTNSTGTGFFYNPGTTSVEWGDNNNLGSPLWEWQTINEGDFTVETNGSYCWNIDAQDTCLKRNGAGHVRAATNTGGGGNNGQFDAAGFNRLSNCNSAGGTCGAATAGWVTMAAAATTVTVTTTAVKTSGASCNTDGNCSHIHIQEDSTKGGSLGVTCNTTIARIYSVTTVTNATSFVITSSAAPAGNPACLSFTID